MSMYNIFHGANPATFFILPMLGKHPDEYPRFRDCFVERRKFTIDEESGLPMMDVKDGGGEAEQVICVFTRMGGGNRECWNEDGNDEDYTADDGTCICPAHEAEKLESHPLFLERFDDDFDCTYSTFVFRVPENFKEDFVAVVEGRPNEVSKEYQDQLRKVYPKLKDNFDEIFGAEK